MRFSIFIAWPPASVEFEWSQTTQNVSSEKTVYARKVITLVNYVKLNPSQLWINNQDTFAFRDIFNLFAHNCYKIPLPHNKNLSQNRTTTESHDKLSGCVSGCSSYDTRQQSNIRGPRRPGDVCTNSTMDVNAVCRLLSQFHNSPL